MVRLARLQFLTFLAALVVAAALPSTSPARSGMQYRIEGRGWGHGIGMSQYGAKGFADHGWSAKQIIEHFYTGAVVAQRPTNGPTALRVKLHEGLAAAQVTVTSPATLSQAGDLISL